MKVELFPFQKRALAAIRENTSYAMKYYRERNVPQVVSFTAPTGTGKTIIMASLIESIFFGDESHEEQQNAIIVWLSDSPELNEQSKLKIDTKADKIRLSQCITVSEDSFDKEVFEDGRIYFLNTQKLSKSSKLTRNGDDRTYTIWETLANTVRDKSDRFYLIIDEAHRGMQGSDAEKATTIMQKFIKGSAEDSIPPMPVVIGMSATIDRFNTLVGSTSTNTQSLSVTSDDVRSSGLLKDRIVITYPEEDSNNVGDMAILKAAAMDWKEKWEHWSQYCSEQHYAHVNPIFIIQVLNRSETNLTKTDLDACLEIIEDATGFQLETGQVVQTFEQTTSSIRANGIDVRYEEPSRIAEDRNIRIVFFKENLSTGWDCPRAETMMSFKHANDATYIAQLLGRMIRTPMQMRIQVDDVLNDVRLYLPYFKKDTVKDIIEALQSSEGGDFPTDIYSESLSAKKYDTLTVKPKKKKGPGSSDQMTIDMFTVQEIAEGATPHGIQNHDAKSISTAARTEETDKETHTEATETQPQQRSHPVQLRSDHVSSSVPEPTQITPVTSSADHEKFALEPQTQNEPEGRIVSEDIFDREAVMKFINEEGLPTYEIRKVRINNYLKSLYQMAWLLTMSDLYREAISDVRSEIADTIHGYVEQLKEQGTYDDLVLQAMQFRLDHQTYSAFGENMDYYYENDLLTTTDTDIDRQFRKADEKLGNEGIGFVYGNKYGDMDNPNGFKVDVILFEKDDKCRNRLEDYAKDRFHNLRDDYRLQFTRHKIDKIREDYDRIVSDGDAESKHSFRLPETIKVPFEIGGKEYKNHLFVSEETGMAKINLNGWEAGLIEEEEKRDDFVCWIRNPARASWSLCIRYEMGGEIKGAYPDFIIIRKDKETGYVIDILEPHDPNNKDNLGKAKGFAEYARKNPRVGRFQLIRMRKDAVGKNHFLRLDMSKSAIQSKVSKINNNDELDHIFDTDGKVEV